MTAQLESRHFFQAGDEVQHRTGTLGRVLDHLALYATIRWMDGREEEVDQFDPRITVIERASRH